MIVQAIPVFAFPDFVIPGQDVQSLSVLGSVQLGYAAYTLREDFQSKKQQNLGIWHLGGGGVVEKSKKSQVSVGNSSK